MLNKALPLIGIFFLSIILATAGAATAAPSTKAVTDASVKDPPLTLSIVFTNGLNTTTETQGSNFTASCDIANVPAPGIDFFSIGIQWNPANLELQHNNTATDILEGTTGNFTGSTGWSFANVAAGSTDLKGGILEGVAGYDLSGNSTGHGILFTMNFTCKAVGTGDINITAINGLYTYLSSDGNAVNIDAGYNAALTITTIPEFPASAVLPIFLVVTTVAIAAATVSSRKRRILPRVSQHE
jgi:hypothetical protein